MSELKTHTFNERKYKILVEKLDGDCDIYSLNDRYLCVFADMNKRNGLISAIHEALHAENWTKSEEVVDRVSREIGSFLWRLGYRKVK